MRINTLRKIVYDYGYSDRIKVFRSNVDPMKLRFRIGKVFIGPSFYEDDQRELDDSTLGEILYEIGRALMNNAW
ncbi:MAG TPA: hypothetical protein PLT75_14345 [Spirochaetota bacterium]|nr:hypothetical protein [Spirochaetota bacterium]HPJ39622.1 hypothetical protein [Spirochaetota bacterium]